jgi:hypothetical protein
MALEKIVHPRVTFFFFELTSMILKRTFIPSVAFRPFLPLDGVKSKGKKTVLPLA